jgi:hypothetical protein
MLKPGFPTVVSRLAAGDTYRFGGRDESLLSPARAAAISRNSKRAVEIPRAGVVLRSGTAPHVSIKRCRCVAMPSAVRYFRVFSCIAAPAAEREYTTRPNLSVRCRADSPGATPQSSHSENYLQHPKLGPWHQMRGGGSHRSSRVDSACPGQEVQPHSRRFASRLPGADPPGFAA